MVAPAVPELSEEILHESIDARTESLAALRELGPPDLVHLLKQATRNAGKQVCFSAIDRSQLLGHIAKILRPASTTMSQVSMPRRQLVLRPTSTP
jgi:hypothetical protein